MCTVIIANHHYKQFPLVVAANRDEQYSRPSSPVRILSKEPLIVGGRDEVKGGTWLGVNKESIFITGTNQGKTDPNPKYRSRGLLIMDALKCKTLDELLSFVEEIDPSQYNGFNLVFGNSKAVFIAHSYLLHSMVIRELVPGIHVISSDMKFTGENEKNNFIHGELDRSIDTPWLDYYKNIRAVLGNRKYGVRITPKKKDSSGTLFGHCTRSSSVLAFSDDGLERYKFYDRTAPKAEENNRAIFKDYIGIWKDPESWKEEPVVSLPSDIDIAKRVMEKKKVYDLLPRKPLS